jgi:hypothetical protein
MRFIIKGANENISTLTRKIGYRVINTVSDQKEYSAIRSIQGADFPRFHLYIIWDKKTGNFNINLHLDQKKPSYSGTSAHGGEYEGEVVEREAERIKKLG